MSEHTIAIPLDAEEFIEVNVLYNAFTTLNLQHPNKRDKTRPEFYKELMHLGMEHLKRTEKEKWEEAIGRFKKLK